MLGSARSLIQRFPRTCAWLTVYQLSALTVLGTVLVLTKFYGPAARDALMAAFLPTEWHSFLIDLGERVFLEKITSIAISAGYGGVIVLIGITLFPIKEKLSLTYEEERFPEIDRGEDVSLPGQGWEEVKLLFLYLLFQLASLYLFVQGSEFLGFVSKGLSYFYLILAMALDHCLPFFHRRGKNLQQTAYFLLRHAPVYFLLMGVLCMAPAIILEQLTQRGFRADSGITLLVFTEVLGMTAACIAGSHLGGKLVTRMSQLELAPRWWNLLYNSISICAFAFFITALSWWLQAASNHHQLLKCRYEPLWRDFSYKVTGKESTDGRDAIIRLSLPLAVHNPTDSNLSLDYTTFHLLSDSTSIGQAKALGDPIPSNGSQTLHLEFSVTLPTKKALRGDFSAYLKGNYHGELRCQPRFSSELAVEVF